MDFQYNVEIGHLVHFRIRPHGHILQLEGPLKQSLDINTSNAFIKMIYDGI